MDRIDWRILDEVQKDGRITVNEIANRVNLTKSPCLERLRRLERDGYVRGYHAELSPSKVGEDYVVFVQVKLVSTAVDTLEKFNRAVKKIPEIQACHMMAGGFDYLLKIRTSSMSDYRVFLGEVLASLPNVLQTTSFPVMQEVKNTTELRLRALEK